MSKNASSSSSSGIGIVGLLQVAFIVLKLLNEIQWSWFQVFLPTIIPVGIVIIVLLVLLLIAIIKKLK